MRLSPRRTRRGFTLLEVLLASLIAVFLLGALYFAMDLTLRRTQDARDAVEVDNLARGAFNKISLDLSASLAPLPPKSGGNANSTPSTATTDPAATATEGTTDPAATDPAAADPESAAAAADVPFQAGVIGTETQVTVFLARTPDVGFLDANVQGRADQRRVTYWLGADGGLCRQERPWVTADGIRNSVDPDLTYGEENDTIVAEVKDLQFEYFDGSGWAGTWDGSILGPDGVTPQGPPRAVRVTLTMEFPPSRGGMQPVTRTAVQVIPIRAAPGTYTPPLLDPYTEGTTDTTTTDMGGMGGTGTTGTGGTTPTGGTGATGTGGTGTTGGNTSTTGGGR